MTEVIHPERLAEDRIAAQFPYIPQDCRVGQPAHEYNTAGTRTFVKFPEAAQHFKAVDDRHHEVHKDRVVMLPGDHLKPDFTVRGGVYLKTIEYLDTRLECDSHRLLVVDHKNPAGCYPKIGFIQRNELP